MTAVSFVDKFVKSGSVPIHFVRCKNTAGKDCYHFLMCSPQKIRSLKNNSESVFDLSEYGQVLISGFGNDPSDSVKKMLLDKYGFDAGSVIENIDD